MITIEAIHIAPVKSLALVQPQTVHVGSTGIVEDRRLHLIDGNGALLTQRQVGPLVQVKAHYQLEPERLTLSFPGGEVVDGPLERRGPVTTAIWGRQVPGHVVEGDWAASLSAFCGLPVRLVQSVLPGQSYDEYPMSLMSQASIDYLGQQSEDKIALESRRFRPNFLLTGCEPHQEDDWVGGVIRVGSELLVQVVARDPRCAITTHSPDTGERDVDTLRLILNYRPSSRAPYFGIYGVVVRPGTVSLGDPVVVPFTG
jgi:uncharacterized protein YcbX